MLYETLRTDEWAARQSAADDLRNADGDSLEADSIQETCDATLPLCAAADALAEYAKHQLNDMWAANTLSILDWRIKQAKAKTEGGGLLNAVEELKAINAVRDREWRKRMGFSSPLESIVDLLS